MTGTLPGRYGTLMFDNNYYFMQVNEWNSSASQVMSYGGDYLFKMTTQMASTATNGGPTGFPSIFIGANSQAHDDGQQPPQGGDRADHGAGELDLGRRRHARRRHQQQLQRHLRRLVQHQLRRRAELVGSQRRLPDGLAPQTGRRAADRRLADEEGG